jgi:hypothetical protein
LSVKFESGLDAPVGCSVEGENHPPSNCARR